MKIEKSRINESGFSRIFNHLNDDSTFMVIGSQDKDTKLDRSNELLKEIKNLNLGFKPLIGNYEYEDGSIGKERSFMIMNISKQQALDLMYKFNQESIIWKDNNFFGLIFNDISNEPLPFKKDIINFTNKDIDLFGSAFAKHKNKNQLKPFKFVLEGYKQNNSFRLMNEKTRLKEEIITIYF